MRGKKTTISANPSPRYIKVLACVCAVILFVGGVLSYIAYSDMGKIEQKRQDELLAIKKLRWNLYKATVNENIDKASISAKFISRQIQHDIEDVYRNDNLRLRSDLQNLNDDSAVSIITNCRVSNTYLNKKSDDNDPFVAMRWGIIADRSLNCATEKLSRTWEEEFKKHYNPVLARDAVGMILNQSPELKFWEFKTPANPYHEILTSPSWEGLERVFLKEGEEGLRGYEILVPAYVKEDEDLLGTKDVSNAGIRQNNYKLIIVQGFNIVDAVSARHTGELEYLNYLESIANRTAEADKRQKATELYLSIPLLCVVFTLSAYSLNKILANREEFEHGDYRT